MIELYLTTQKKMTRQERMKAQARYVIRTCDDYPNDETREAIRYKALAILAS